MMKCPLLSMGEVHKSMKDKGEEGGKVNMRLRYVCTAITHVGISISSSAA